MLFYNVYYYEPNICPTSGSAMAIACGHIMARKVVLNGGQTDDSLEIVFRC